MKSLSERLKQRADNLHNGVTRVMRQVGLETLRDLTVSTPVDTGRARSNWLVGVNAPPTSEIEPYAVGSKGSTGGANAQMAFDAGEIVIKGFENKGDDTLYLRNNLDYIDKLNDGFSRQAGAHFIESAVKGATDSVKNMRLLD